MTLSKKALASADEHAEIDGLTVFADTLRAITPAVFSKYQRFAKHLKDPAFGWAASDGSDRIVVFSERIETLNWLSTQMTSDFGLKPNQLAVLHGQMTDTEQQVLVDRFGRLDDPIRVLLCSDVASEGLNLHYFCHRLVHFDLPWSLMVFQQRNGRVDRYGQKFQPQIVYLFTETDVEKIRGDLRILEILEKKDEQANLNLGDPASFLNVYDPDKEADKVSGFMATGLSAEVVETKLDMEQQSNAENEGNWLLNLFGGADATGADTAAVVPSSLDSIVAPVSLFAGEYQFAKTALTQLCLPDPIAQWTHDDAAQTIAITAPLDLQERLRQLPREVQAANDRYVLCASSDRMALNIEQARQAKAEDDTWPQLHYLWPQHPIVEWLGDRVLTAFGRHSAPVLQSAKLAPGEQAFILMSLVPNRKGQPLLAEWQVACRSGATGSFMLESFDTFIARAGLKAGAIPNSNKALPMAELQSALPGAVKAMQAHMATLQSVFAAEMATRLEGTLADLKRLQSSQMVQLTLQLERGLEFVARSRFEQRTRQVNSVFDDYRLWVADTLTTEPQPYIQVLAAVCGPAQ